MRRRGFLKALAGLPAVGAAAAVVKPAKVEPEPLSLRVGKLVGDGQAGV